MKKIFLALLFFLFNLSVILSQSSCESCVACIKAGRGNFCLEVCPKNCSDPCSFCLLRYHGGVACKDTPGCKKFNTKKSYEVSQNETIEVFQRHSNAFLSKNVDGILANYAEDGALILNGKVYKDKEQIKKVFKYSISIFENFGRQEGFEEPAFQNEVVYLRWRFLPQNKTESLLGTDTIVVLNGKIHTQTVSCDIFDEIPMA